MLHTMLHNMFHLELPILEKIVRPILVYLCLIAFLRLFGKRELAQLNPFDLVVLLSLSNTVQNSIIGEDNSVTGGIVGAFSLLAVNWLLSRVLFKSQKLTEVVEGTPTVLVRDGQVIQKAMKEETMTHEELISVLNKNGFNRPEDVKLCILEPTGTFYVEGITPTQATVQSADLMHAVERLASELRDLRAEIAAKG